MPRALLFRAGTVGLLCAAYEVEITPGTETHRGTITPVRDCTNPATERIQGTSLCAECATAFANSPQVGVVEGTIRPETN
jgi:hypothetical protein